jgi:hypothetical protein
VQLHFALFNGTEGFVLKPPEMLNALEGADDGAFWPPPRNELHVVSLEVLSLHNLPKRGERRPR